MTRVYPASAREHRRILRLRVPFALTEAEIMVAHLDALGVPTGSLQAYLASAKALLESAARDALEGNELDTPEQAAGGECLCGHDLQEHDGTAACLRCDCFRFRPIF